MHRRFRLWKQHWKSIVAIVSWADWRWLFLLDTQSSKSGNFRRKRSFQIDRWQIYSERKCARKLNLWCHHLCQTRHKEHRHSAAHQSHQQQRLSVLRVPRKCHFWRQLVTRANQKVRIPARFWSWEIVSATVIERNRRLFVFIHQKYQVNWISWKFCQNWRKLLHFLQQFINGDFPKCWPNIIRITDNGAHAW